MPECEQDVGVGLLPGAVPDRGLVLERGQGGAPEEVFLADRVLQGLGVLWLICVGLGVYV